MATKGMARRGRNQKTTEHTEGTEDDDDPPLPTDDDVN